MIGDAPSASVALADWFVTTLLVIYRMRHQRPYPRARVCVEWTAMTPSCGRVRTWWTSGENCFTDARIAPTAVLTLSTVYCDAVDGATENVRNGDR